MSPLVKVHARHPSFSPDEAYEMLRDFPRHALMSDAVREVEVEEQPDGSFITSWEVNFRNGILIWSEFDEFDPDNNTVRFNQRDGDPEDFSGYWCATPDPSGEGCRLKFEAQFEVGIPTLGDMLEPIAARTLRDNVIQTLEGVFGESLELTEEETSDEVAESSPSPPS
jgi:hypothetical protein